MRLLKRNGLQNLLLFLFLILIAGIVIFFQERLQTSVYDFTVIDRYKVAGVAFKNMNEDRGEKKKLEDLIREQISLITSRRRFASSLAVVEKHEKTIRKEAEEIDFPEDLAIGVALLENGGSEKAISSAGAAGVYQLIPGTARNLGLKVDEETDERLDPDKNIAAGVRYLKGNLDLFGDPGLAVWSHHAGPQNVSRALKIYAKSKGLAEPLTYREALDQRKLTETKESWRELVNSGVDTHKLLQNSDVQEFLSGLSDETNLYTYKAIAAAIIFESRKDQSKDQFLEKVRSFNRGDIQIANLLEK